MTSPASLPSGCLDIPPRLNITDHAVSRHVQLGQGDRPALGCDGDVVSYAELDDWTDRVAASLHAAGVGAGDRFVLWSPNSVWYALAVLAGLKAGAVPVLVSSGWKRKQVEAVVRQTGARGVLLTPELSERRAAGFRTVDLALSDLIAGPHPAVPSVTAADDTAYVVCVLDGRREPRAVAYAHRVVIAAGDPIRYGLLRLTPEDTCLVPEELSAPFAFDFALGLPLSAGARALVHQGSDDPGAILSAVERHAATILVGTPRLYECLGAARAGKLDLGSLRLAVCLGDGLPERLQGELRRHLGLDVVAAAATPETHVFAATADGDGRADALGFPLPGRTVDVLTDRGDRAAPGQVGELCFPPGDPALAVGCGGADGWYRSGRLAYRDDDGSLRRATS